MRGMPPLFMSRLRRAAYRPLIGRINLQLSDHLHAAIVAKARRYGLSAAALAREYVARGIGQAEGRDDADDMRRAVAELEKRVAALEAERGKSDTG